MPQSAASSHLDLRRPGNKEKNIGRQIDLLSENLIIIRVIRIKKKFKLDNETEKDFFIPSRERETKKKF